LLQFALLQMILIISDSEMLRNVTVWTDKGSLSDRLRGIRDTDISSPFFLPPLISNTDISIPDRWAKALLRVILILNSLLQMILNKGFSTGFPQAESLSKHYHAHV